MPALLDLLASGKVHIDIDRVPLSAVGEIWAPGPAGPTAGLHPLTGAQV